MFRPYLLTEPEEKILTEKAVSGVSAWSRLYEEVLGGIRVDLEGEDEPVALEIGDGEALLGRPRRAPGSGRGA